MKMLHPKWITLIVILLFFAASNNGNATDKYPVCKEVQENILLTIRNPVAEIELRPDCWSSLIIIADYVKRINVSYVGKEEPKVLHLIGITVVDGIPVAVILHNRFRLRGDGKFTIRIFHVGGVDI